MRSQCTHFDGFILLVSFPPSLPSLHLSAPLSKTSHPPSLSNLLPPPCLHPHTSNPPFSVSLSVSMLPPCLRLSLPLFAFNSWGHPGPLGSYPRMLSRLTSCGVAFWTERATEPGLDRCSDSTMYSATATPRKKRVLQRFFGYGCGSISNSNNYSKPLIVKCTPCSIVTSINHYHLHL